MNEDLKHLVDYYSAKQEEIDNCDFDEESLYLIDSNFKDAVMEDGKVFSPSIHRRFLPVQYMSMVKGGYLMPASPLKFTWAIRRWLGLEMSNINRMKEDPNLENECKVRMLFLGKEIYSYLSNKARMDENLLYGRGLGRRDAWEWVYMVPEKWIHDNLEELYKSFLAMGCYYTITSLQAFGKLKGTLEGVTANNETITLELTSSKDVNLKVMKGLADTLRNDSKFRDSLSLSCLSKLNLEGDKCRNHGRGAYLKNEDGAIEKFKNFYAKEVNTKKATKELFAKYGVPTVGEAPKDGVYVTSSLYID